MRAAFNQPRMEDSLNLDGYVVVDFMNLDELEEVQEGIRELGFGVDDEMKFRISVIQYSVEKRNEIFEKLSPLFRRTIDEYLQDYKLIRIAIFDKLPGGGDIRVHQHANLVDESKYRSLTTWIPLTDTTVEMGTLHVVRGSHVFSNHVRSYDDYYYAFDGVSKKIIKKCSTPILLGRGQAIIFDDRLIHWSPPNKSASIRTAIQLELIPRESELAIYYRANDQELLKYAIDEKTYRVTNLASKKPEDLQLTGKLKQPNVSYGNRQFISMIRDINPDDTRLKRNFFQRLFNL